MSEEKKVQKSEVSVEELEAEAGEMLPERQEMSLIDANIAAPVNAAVALNIASEDSTAIAYAQQDVDIDQSITDDSTTTIDPSLNQ